MAKPIIKFNNLELHKYKGKHVFPLYQNMSDQNIREFEVLYEGDILENLIDCLDDELCHVIESDGKPIAICGVSNQVLWTMFTKDIRKHWRSFVKASPKLIDFYHHFYDQLYCSVWDENVFIQNWLVHLGFHPYEIEDRYAYSIVNFVRCISPCDSIDSKESRPVMH